MKNMDKPAGIATKALLHYGQLVESGKHYKSEKLN